MNTKTLAILSIAAVGAVVTAVAVIRSDRTRASSPAALTDASGKPTGLFSGLSGRINDVAAVTVKTSAAECTIEQADGQWRLKEKSGYPVDAGKVRTLLLSLTSLTNFEPRTNRPELHKTLGVEDVAAPAAAADSAVTSPGSLLLTLKDKSGQTIESVIVGNIKWGGGMGGASQGIYLRKPGDNQSYYADGKLEVPREPLTWVNNEFADIARDRVRSVTLVPRSEPDAGAITVARDQPGEGAFKVTNLPAGRELKDTGLPETLVAGLVRATFEDVAPASTIDFAASPGASVVIRTWDGLLVTAETADVSGRSWWRLSAAADPDPFKEGEGDAAKPKRTAEEVAKEVADLNARWQTWAFSPYSYKAAAFNKRLSDELKDAAPPPAAPDISAPAPTEPPPADAPPAP